MAHCWVIARFGLIIYLWGTFEQADLAQMKISMANFSGNAWKEKEHLASLELEDVATLCHLVVFNDDVNTFDHVIRTLIRVCQHSPEQAEQCAMIIHYRGKCSVKSGEFDFLKPMKEAICEAGIDARILETI